MAIALKTCKKDSLKLKAFSNMAMYWARYRLWTPRKGLIKFLTPVHNPSVLLQWTSLIPSPSSSRANSLAE